MNKNVELAVFFECQECGQDNEAKILLECGELECGLSEKQKVKCANCGESAEVEFNLNLLSNASDKKDKPCD